jgi:hypothetical protein
MQHTDAALHPCLLLLLHVAPVHPARCHSLLLLILLWLVWLLLLAGRAPPACAPYRPADRTHAVLKPPSDSPTAARSPAPAAGPRPRHVVSFAG